MQCPECNHIPLAGTQPDPTRCPECGIYYEKAAELKLKRQQVLQAAPPIRPQYEPPAVGGAYDVQAAAKKYPGAQPVVLIDVQMSFGSMIVFMVKWALASIPAIIILSIIFFLLMAAVGFAGR